MKQFIEIILDDTSYIFKWIEGEPDYIEKTDGSFLNYRDEKAESTFNIDALIRDISNNDIDCTETIDSINLMTDFGFPTKSLLTDNTYEKLFAGCNLPSVMSGREKYFPSWNNTEIKEFLDCVTKIKEIKSKIKKFV